MTTSASQPSVWFITGCSTGFGREFVRVALAHGFRVVATARDPKKLDDLIAGHKEKAIALELDVTRPADIKRAVQEAERAFGSIDVLVNNAGYGYLAAVEEGEDKDIRAMFDTNFFGLAAVTRAVLPGMRKKRRGDDRQYRVGRRNCRLPRIWILRGNQIRSRGVVGIARKRSRALGDPRDAGRAWPIPYRLGWTIAETIYKLHRGLRGDSWGSPAANSRLQRQTARRSGKSS